MTTSSTEEEAMSPCTSRRMVEDVFLDFQGRRLAILKARTTEFKSFYEQCDPRKENLCLFGLASEQWKVDLPSEEVPQEMPEPSLGVNFARDGKDIKDWLANVAVHSDAWLISVAFYFGARFHFDKNERKRLFNMINELPTILEVVTGTAKKQVKNKATNSNHGSNKPKSNSKRGSESMGKHAKVSRARELREDYEDGTEDTEDENGLALCGACGTNYDPGEFWIMCDVCDRWFHGQCVKVTPAMAERIKQYICPSCSNKRSRP